LTRFRLNEINNENEEHRLIRATFLINYFRI
jgi:hypothetical protein